MFRRTRVQLTIRNAAVLSVILISLNVSVFWIMKQMLFDRIDLSLTSIRDENRTMTVVGPYQKTISFRLGQMDRPLIQLFWTEDHRPIPLPGSGGFGEEELNQLQPTNFGHSPHTVKVGDQYFRLLNIDDPGMVAAISGDGTTHRIMTQQLLSNVSAEMDMLRRLRYILLIGGSIGLIVAVAAGYGLANRALKPIRLSWEKQQQFVSDASHELRTPLSVIQAHTELLLRHPDHTIEQDSLYISTVLQESRRMTKLVGNLLTLARTDSNQLELEFKSVLLDQIVQDTVRKMEMLAKVKDIALSVEIDASLPMQADEERLQQLLMALLDNAIKFTPESGVIRVICRRLAQSVQIEVVDNGRGIAPEHLPHVFDRFYRGDKARSRYEGGTGLGLSIAQWIVERHGGKIRVESALSSGTRVIVQLPV